jgi:hypothetical protein
MRVAQFKQRFAEVEGSAQELWVLLRLVFTCINGEAHTQFSNGSCNLHCLHYMKEFGSSTMCMSFVYTPTK